MDSMSSLNAVSLSREEALEAYRRLSHYIPGAGYPWFDMDELEVSDPMDAGRWQYGRVGDAAEVDLDFEVKKGGPWGAWMVSKNGHLYVASHPDAPTDRLLYFISRRVTCFLRVHRSWHRMISAAAQAGYTEIGRINDYGVWTRHPDAYFTLNH